MKIFEKFITKKLAENTFKDLKIDDGIQNKLKPENLNIGFSFSMLDDMIPTPVSIESISKDSDPIAVGQTIDSPVQNSLTICDKNNEPMLYPKPIFLIEKKHHYYRYARKHNELTNNLDYQKDLFYFERHFQKFESQTLNKVKILENQLSAGK